MKASTHMIMKAAVVFHLAAISTLASGCCRDGYRSSVETLERDRWIGMLSSSFADTRIRLNNYTEERFAHDDSEELAYYEPNDSNVVFMVNGMAYAYEFDIPVIRKDPPSIYVVDINASEMALDARGGRAIVSIEMESRGHEFWTNCVANFFCGAIGNREVNVDDMEITIGLELEMEGGQVTYDRDDIAIDVSGDVSVSGCNDDLFAFLCDLFFADRESRIKTAIRDAFVSQLRSGVVRTAISLSFDDYIRNNLGIEGEITEVTVGEDGSLIINSREPDPTC